MTSRPASWAGRAARSDKLAPDGLSLANCSLDIIADGVADRMNLVNLLHMGGHLAQQQLLIFGCPLPTAGVVCVSSPELISHVPHITTTTLGSARFRAATER